MKQVALAITLGLAALSGPGMAAQTFVDPAHTDIPERFRGLWALGSTKCSDERGPAFVEIGSRSIYFYEKYGSLRLAQLDHASEQPSFYGKFDFAGALEFWEQVVRIDEVLGGIAISLIRKSDDPPSKMTWHRCSP